MGQRWTLLVLRDLFLGVHRFDDLVASLGITRRVLARRLAHLEDHGLVDRVAYQDRPPATSTATIRTLTGRPD